jgi:hypothetical protein
VHKEWCYYLHNFQESGLVLPPSVKDSKPQEEKRSNQTALRKMLFNQDDTTQSSSDKRITPLFILFLDAVAQLVKMNPFAFEF